MTFILGLKDFLLLLSIKLARWSTSKDSEFQNVASFLDLSNLNYFHHTPGPLIMRFLGLGKSRIK